MYKFNFASLIEAQVLLGKKDEYISKMSDYEKKLKLGDSKKYSLEDYQEFLGSCALEWKESEMQKISLAVNEINKKLKEMKKFLDVPITFVKSNGLEEWNSAYTRGTCIIIPEKKLLKYEGYKLEGLIIHELFHVFSRNNVNLRNSLYEAIGYTETNTIDIPESIRIRKLTNPDSVHENYCTSFKYEGEDCFVVPIVMLEDKKNNVDATKDILSSISIKLLLLDKKYRAIIKNGEPIFINSNEVIDLNRKKGIEIDHIDQPEEIIAELFTNIVMGNYKFDSPIINMLMNILY